MRLTPVLLLLAAFAAPAFADETIADQAHDAYRLYAGGLSQKDFLFGQYATGVFSGIGGSWVRLGGPDDKSGMESYGPQSQKLCGTPSAVTLAASSPDTMSLATNLTGDNFTQDYTLVSGSTFAVHTDPVPYFKAVGLGPDKSGDTYDQQRAILLSQANGVLQIYRPSPDILVLSSQQLYPIVLARCPKT
jgi:hypothetical protein